MSILELFILAVGLSMDACAIAICKGLAMKNAGLRQMCIVGAWFGLAQAAMPLIGYLLGTGFADYITSFDHWIAFVLLGIIGGVMIKESFDKEENKNDASLAVRIMLPMALATSIDALAVGVTFAFLKVRIIPAVIFIGVVTFAFGAAGVKIGTVFGAKYKAKAELAGGVILILLGVKILLEHLGIIGF